MKTLDLTTQANEILLTLSKGKLKRVYVTVEHHEIFKNFGHGASIGDFIFGGTNENGQQVWLNKSIESVLSPNEFKVYSLSKESNESIAEKMGISAKTVESYRSKISKKGF